MRGSSRSRWPGQTTAERNAEILAAAERGEVIKLIAFRYHLTVERCRKILKRAKVKAVTHPLPVERIAGEKNSPETPQPKEAV